tara:strand:- start:11287 stop:11523 length:237 start_codon:yes stop_codon:yes gene_type:complete
MNIILKNIYLAYLSYQLTTYAVLSVPIVKEPECCESCGYSYCPSLDDCVRPWITYCKEFDFPYNILYQESGIIIPDKK